MTDSRIRAVHQDKGNQISCFEGSAALATSGVTENSYPHPTTLSFPHIVLHSWSAVFSAFVFLPEHSPKAILGGKEALVRDQGGPGHQIFGALIEN